MESEKTSAEILTIELSDVVGNSRAGQINTNAKVRFEKYHWGANWR